MFIGVYGSISYNVVIMYCFYYLFASFTNVLPWVSCHNNWNTPLCSNLPTDCLEAGGIVSFNNTCIRLRNLTNEELDLYNITFDGFSAIARTCLESGGILSSNNTCLNSTKLSEDQSMFNISSYGANASDPLEGYNLTNYVDPFSDVRVTPSEEYWR